MFQEAMQERTQMNVERMTRGKESPSMSFLQNNLLTILTQVATPASEIDAATARAELAEATAKRITDAASFEERQTDMQRARAKQELATKK